MRLLSGETFPNSMNLMFLDGGYTKENAKITTVLNKVVRRLPIEKDVLKVAVEMFLEDNNIEANAYVSGNGCFGIRNANQSTAIEFLRVIRKADIFQYVSEVDGEKGSFCTGSVNLFDGSSLRVKEDGKNNYQVIFGTQKTTDELVKALLGNKKVSTKNISKCINK